MKVTLPITRNKLILAYADIARSIDATEADKRDARNMILLLIGAGSYFYDQHGDRIVSIEEAIHEKTRELGSDHPDVINMRIARDHQYMIEEILGERESYVLQ
ncbi:hypothetical protein EVC45_02390 [Paraburkholderia sp. UYCP14C]|uniref:hypothetical protein n=1 Tax=Paraburkholderia sp. UYCP14C TaxID=2511130 RepID=UPI0010220837|nr:hypothetical protein [Paraburkholderia sp. UYCP14C]RZF31321.1 hypothetical protein EVC45_02390 [Paraburkholderia sp. UYCP14C]